MKKSFLGLFLIFLASATMLATGCSKSGDDNKPTEEKAEKVSMVSKKTDPSVIKAPEKEKLEDSAELVEIEDQEGIIRMENPAYSEHLKSIVLFSHKKHYSEYKIVCGECHHDKNGKPLENLKEGDEVDDCIDCHKIPSEMSKAEKKEIKSLPEEDQLKRKLEYHAEAIHKNCRNCHKAWNKENNKSSKEGAPTSCTQCHPKE